ncbi:MAG: protein kinase, partial [Myxococcales bacterium]|nr:protein kinase [Myxococcales bacterium]
MPEPSESQSSQSTPRNTKIAAIEDLIKSTGTTPIPGQTPVPTSTPLPAGRRTPRLGLVDIRDDDDDNAAPGAGSSAVEIVVDVEADLAAASGSRPSTPGIRQSWLDVALAEKIMAQQRPEPLHLSPGAIIPGTRYRIVRWIGDGGMGVVYEAEQDEPKRRVALKVLRAGLDSEEARSRFQREARILGNLQDAGIAALYGVGTHEAASGERVPYLVMELVRGGRPITAYADGHHLDLKRRLQLFLD